MKKLSALFILLTSLYSFSQSTQNPVQHVILIGIDGVSAEAFQYASTPFMDELVAKGSVSLKTRGVMPTVSAPNWATILSGAGPEQHGVTSNNWSIQKHGFQPTVCDSDGYFTSIFTLIRQQRPLASTAMIFDWEWLGTYINKKVVDTMIYITGAQQVTDAAADYIVRNKPYFTFVYYGHPDETGHAKGFNTADYYQAISEVDGEIRRLIDSVKHAGIFENTAFLITSDHGGRGYGHGGESMIEITVPWMIFGPGIRKNAVLQDPNNLENTAPTIADILGMKLPVEWTGKPVREALLKAKEYSKRQFSSYVPKPQCSVKDGIYLSPQPAVLTSKLNDADIRYTLDGTIPDLKSRKYSEQILLATPISLTAVAYKGSVRSEPVVVNVNIIKGINNVELLSGPSAKYPGKGAISLVDGNKGTADYTNEAWLGYEGTDFEAVVDFGKKRDFSRLGLEVLQQPGNWIFLPALVEYSISDNGTDWQPVCEIDPANIDDIRLDGPVLLSRKITFTSARYLRVKARNKGVCPESHPGAGQKAWLFVSEIIAE